MSRWYQDWKCTACGHTSSRSVRYPKYAGAWVERPLAALEKRARCTKCGVRGACTITEWKAGDGKVRLAND